MSTEKLVLYDLSRTEVDNQTNLQCFEISKTLKSELYGSIIKFGVDQAGDPVVIKISSLNWGSSREWIGLNKAFNSGIPVPKPLFYGEDENHNEAIVTRRVDGESLYLQPSVHLKHLLGGVVRDMHDSVAVEAIEWVALGKKDFTYYDEKINQYFSTITTPNLGLKVRDLILHFTNSMSNCLQMIAPVFVHRDLHDGQVLVDKQDNLTLIDFEMWNESLSYDEIAVYLSHSLRTHRPNTEFAGFIKGYLKGLSLSEQERNVISFYLLFNALKTIDYFYRFKTSYTQLGVDQLRLIESYIGTERLWKI